MTISTLSRRRLLCGTAVVLGGAPLVSALDGLIAAPSASAVTLGPGLAGFQAHAAAQSAGGLLLLGDDAAAVRQLTSQLGERHFFVVGVVPAHSHQIAQAVTPAGACAADSCDRAGQPHRERSAFGAQRRAGWRGGHRR